LKVLENRNKMRRVKDKEQANYRGDISVSALNRKQKSLRKKAKTMANWEGDIVISKRKKGQHPSAVYQGGKVANSYQEKEKMRKKMLKKYGKGSQETPNYMKEKSVKAGYDKREAEFWQETDRKYGH
jgi:hypothetical protein